MKTNTWTKQSRVTDENGTPWDQFVNEDGTLNKFESRDCINEDGRLQIGCFPMVRYSRVQDGLQSSFATLRALRACFP